MSSSMQTLWRFDIDLDSLSPQQGGSGPPQNKSVNTKGEIQTLSNLTIVEGDCTILGKGKQTFEISTKGDGRTAPVNSVSSDRD